METYEPLKPCEIQRDDTTGRFERKGTLAKAAKFRREQPAKRRPGGTPFQPGVSGNPAGKPKGTPNRLTKDLKAAILGALEAAGGEEGSVGYLRRLAEDNSSAFASLLGKCLPHTLAADESSGGASVKMTFERGGSSRLRGEPMYYGGRGIKVCDQWKDFAAFHADMGDRPAWNVD